MLKYADIAFCPSHGEIYNSYKKGSLKVPKHITFTDSQGLPASEEILKRSGKVNKRHQAYKLESQFKQPV